MAVKGMLGKPLKALKLFFIYPALSFFPLGLAYRLCLLFSPMDRAFQKEYMDQWKMGLKRCAQAGEGLKIENLDACVRRHLEMLSREALDSVLVPRLAPKQMKKLASVSGTEHIFDALQEKKGLIIVTAHYSRLNMTAYALGHMGIKNGILSQSVDKDNPYLDWIDRIYLKRKLKKYYRVTGGPGLTLKDSPRHIYRALERGKIMVILMDAYPETLKRFYNVPFLGGMLKLPPGIARISKRTGAPLVFASVRPRAGWRVQVNIEQIPAIGEEGLELAASKLEKEIKKDPCQWWQWPYMNAMWKEGPGSP